MNHKDSARREPNKKDLGSSEPRNTVLPFPEKVGLACPFVSKMNHAQHKDGTARETSLEVRLLSFAQIMVTDHRKDIALFCQPEAESLFQISAIVTNAGELASYLSTGYWLRNSDYILPPKITSSWFEQDVSDTDLYVRLQGHYIQDADVDENPDISGYNFHAFHVKLRPI